MDKIKLYKDVLSMIGIEIEKDGFYHTNWGKKTEEGMIASLDNILSPILKQIAELQEKLNNRKDLILKMQDELVELRQKVHKRNLQIADLKKKLADYCNYCARTEQIDELKSKLKDYNSFICKHCPELASGKKNFGCLGCKYWDINR